MSEETSADAAVDEIPDRSHELIGTEIGGRYRVTGVLGQGGMGVVYRALHLELQQSVAIKVLPAIHARDGETLKRFEQEARTASRVKHPNVVQVFDLGRLATGEPYLAMELLQGRDLESLLVEGKRLSQKELLDVLTPMAAALDALHQQRVVHRDVKPSNVFYTRTSNGAETVKLVDFGLATLTAAGEGAERLTRVGHVVGTAVYMPPESARGALCEPSGDIYSLAVMAFELIAGHAPFDGQPMAVLMDKVSQRAPTLSSIAGTTFPAAVEALFAEALDRDPTRRPRTATDFVQRLARALDDASVSVAAAPSNQVRAPDATPTGPLAAVPMKRRTELYAGVGVLALVLIVGGYFARESHTSAEAIPAPATPIVPATPQPPIAPVEPALDLDVEAAPPPPSVVEAPPPSVASDDQGETPPPSSVRSRVSTTRPQRVPEAEHVVAAPEPETPAATPDSTDRSGSLVRDAQRAMLHGEIPRARELYREATLASPHDAAAWRGLGLASERLHLVPEARTAYERYLQLAPSAGDAATVRDRLSRL